MSTQRHPTRREEYADQQGAIMYTRDSYRTTEPSHPEYATRKRLLRIAYRNLIEVAPAADKTYWREQRDAEFPESVEHDGK